jgi:hypothetical protein
VNLSNFGPPVKLIATTPRRGGTQLPFICPMTQKRARILYLPDSGKQFASRQAHGL